MTPKHLYEIFKDLFNWFVPHVTSFTTNRKDGGIDISLDTGEILNFQINKSGSWILRRK